MRWFAGSFILSMLLAGTVSTSRAESGSCYRADALGEAYLKAMVRDLVDKGMAFRLANGDYYAVFENLPNASICDLEDADLSDMDLSAVEIGPEQLENALLCDTVLPGGGVSRRDCE